MTEQNLDNILCSLEYSLSAASKSPWTVSQYKRAVLKFNAWHAEHTSGEFPEGVTRQHVIAWLISMQKAGLQQNSIRHYYAGVRAFFNWFEFEPEGEALVKDGWRNPTYKVKAPKEIVRVKDIVPAAEMARVLSGLDKAARHRDAALVSFIYDNGARASEVCGAKTVDVSWRDGSVLLHDTKNNEEREAFFSATTGARLDRYLRTRKRGRDYPYLFDGQKGPLTVFGVHQLVKRTFKSFGLEGIGPHDLRHTFASAYMEGEGAREGDLQTVGGWKSGEIARRYAKGSQTKRAHDAHKRLSPVERLKR